jgi:hypothetical protein
MRFTTNDIFTHKISYFLRVFKYDFSQWPKTLYNTYVYIIINNNVSMKKKQQTNSSQMMEVRTRCLYIKNYPCEVSIILTSNSVNNS